MIAEAPEVVDLDQNPIAQLPPPANPDQNIAVPVGIRAVNMAEDRTLLPKPFRGTPDQDASEFWRRLKTYMTYKDLDAASRLKLTTAMMTESACDWIEKLPDAEKLTIDDLQTALEKRYIKPAALRFRSACEVFHISGNVPGDTQKCPKCGRNAHSNLMFCPANSQRCSFCGKFGHFRRCCRLARNE